MHSRVFTIFGAIVMGILAANAQAREPRSEYLSEIVYGIQRACPDKLGIDATAYVVWPKYELGKPLKIHGKDYRKGLGVDSPGEIVLLLDGQYDAFDAMWTEKTRLWQWRRLSPLPTGDTPATSRQGLDRQCRT
jgi:hypothetical protein